MGLRRTSGSLRQAWVDCPAFASSPPHRFCSQLNPGPCTFALLSYLNHLKKSMPAPNAYETFTLGYEDYLEIPLQARRLPVTFGLTFAFSSTSVNDVPLFLSQNIPASHGQFGIADV